MRTLNEKIYKCKEKHDANEFWVQCQFNSNEKIDDNVTEDDVCVTTHTVSNCLLIFIHMLPTCTVHLHLICKKVYRKGLTHIVLFPIFTLCSQPCLIFTSPPLHIIRDHPLLPFFVAFSWHSKCKDTAHWHQNKMLNIRSVRTHWSHIEF